MRLATMLLIGCLLGAALAGAQQTDSNAAADPNGPADSNTAAELKPEDVLKPLHYSLVITATPLGPEIERRSTKVFEQTLFSRDDQVFHLLDAGINAGQHEGGGKSLEVRRFGFNMDHGGVNGGLRVMVDNVPQNQSTQGHGQGYLGSLKSLTPELVEEVHLINGPFAAEYGDYSGLGVVHIRLRESLPQKWTARLVGGRYDTYRGFLAFSPNVNNRDAVFAYEGSYANGPFQRPLDYTRHNVTGNYTWVLDANKRFGLKWNGGTNTFNSSGQIPIDEVAAGRLDRYGNLSPGDGGRVHSGRVGAYFSKDYGNRGILKLDGFTARSLFDLYSNFTFYLNDPVNGDGIQQHDSRLSEGANAQYLRPHSFEGGVGLLSVGFNYLDTQTNVDLRHSLNRDPIELFTSGHAHVTNGAGYVQENITLADGKLELGGGLRWDFFRFALQDLIEPDYSGVRYDARLQPKAQVAYRPWLSAPLKLYFNYGRGIASMDARGVLRRPDDPHITTTDFYQFGTSHRFHERFSLLTDFFLIQPSNQLVYIPDDGSIEFTDPSRSYGFEVKTSVGLTRTLSLDAGMTKVLNAYYRGTEPRIYVDSAPHLTANASLTLADWRRWNGSLRMRAINHYRLDGEDPSIVASGHTVFDLALARRITRTVELNFAIDNLFGREYWETQNFFESRLPGELPMERIHATPAYGATVVVGMTIRFAEK
jgi:TonB dependent receptor-like, beta-barrel/TonB-dependent Receptor Plug Domain